MRKIKVGIVMLSYNRADVVLPCLRSLVKAKTNIPFEIYLLDNASKSGDLKQIEEEFNSLHNSHKIEGIFIKSDVNHGFPKGNNLGIKYFIPREDITHMCLLNSDVIVTDYWLDRMISRDVDAVGPITNSCGNEQTIPVSLEIQNENDNFNLINEYAQKRFELYGNFKMNTDFLGFFCFIAKKELFEKVGLLDEQFGRGAFEDDDYCIRMKQAGFELTVARDVFIYHWGSSSFSQIALPKLLSHLKINRELFENKYSLKWVNRGWLPLKAFEQDISFLISKCENDELSEQFKLYFENSETLAKNLSKIGNLSEKETKIFSIINGISFIRKLLKGMRLIASNKNILFLVRYPSKEDLKDGYFQRVNAIDGFLSENKRFYVNYISDQKKFKLFPEMIKVKEGVYEIRPSIGNPIHFIFLIMLVIFIGRIYLHSILRLQSKFHRFLFILSRKRILDIHGVVPEEFEMHGDKNGCEFFNKVEKFAIKWAHVVIGVTGRMVDHVMKKHDIKNKKNLILPILSIENLKYKSEKKYSKSIIYCGGLQKWQQVEKMMEYVNLNKNEIKFAFLVPNPSELKSIYKDKYNAEFPGIIQTADSSEVKNWYKEYSFGLVLREDIIVNNAACPTKLIEYLQYDLVPIVDSPNIGDFKELGYSFSSYKDAIFTEEKWNDAILNNRKVLVDIVDIFKDGGDKLKSIIK